MHQILTHWIDAYKFIDVSELFILFKHFDKMESSFFSQKRYVNDAIDVFVERPVFYKNPKGTSFDSLREKKVNEKTFPESVVIKKTTGEKTKLPIAKNKEACDKRINKALPPKKQKFVSAVNVPILLHPKELKGFYEDCRRIENVFKSSKAMMKQIQQNVNQIRAVFPEFVDLNKKLENAAWNVKAYIKLGEDRCQPEEGFITSTQDDEQAHIVKSYRKEDKKRKRSDSTYDSDNGSIRSQSDAVFSDEDDTIESDSVYDPDNTQTQSTQSTAVSNVSVVSEILYTFEEPLSD